MNDLSPFRYVPVFAGKSKDDEKVVLYRSVDHPQEFHLRVAEGELWALSPGTQITSTFDRLNDTMLMHIVSEMWTGDAIGTKQDAIDEEAIRR